MTKEITFYLIEQNNRNLIEEPIINTFARKNVYFSSGQQSNQLLLNQLIGNLGGYSNNRIFSSTTDYFIVGNKLLGKLKSEGLPEELKNINKKIAQKKGIYDNLIIISEDALIDYCKWRVDITGDSSTKYLLDKL